MPIAEEEIEVGKRVRSSTVRIDKVVREEDRRVEADVVSQRVQVERVPVRRIVDGPVPDRWEGDTLVMSIVEEVVTIEKRLEVVEEVRIRRFSETSRVATTVPVRKEELRTERRDD